MAMEPPSIENCEMSISILREGTLGNRHIHIPKDGIRDRSCRDLVLQLSPFPLSPSGRSRERVRATRIAQ
jgi:hypothetical protein